MAALASLLMAMINHHRQLQTFQGLRKESWETRAGAEMHMPWGLWRGDPCMETCRLCCDSLPTAEVDQPFGTPFLHRCHQEGL